MTYYTDLFKTSDVLVLTGDGILNYPDWADYTFVIAEDDDSMLPYFNVYDEDGDKSSSTYIHLNNLQLQEQVVTVKEVSKVAPSHSTVVIVVKENESSLKLNRAFTDTELDVLNALFGGAQ